MSDTTDLLINMIDRHKMTDGQMSFAAELQKLPPVYVPFPIAMPVTPGWGRVEWVVKKQQVYQLSPAALRVRTEE